MKKYFFTIVVLFFLIDTKYSQNIRLENLRNIISMLLYQKEDGKLILDTYMFDSFIDVDSIINRNEDDFIEYGLNDPYQTLRHCVLFAAIDTSKDLLNKKEYFGVYKNDQILWLSEGIDECSRGRLIGTLDLNNNETVEMIFACNSGINGEYEQIWIYSWDGLKGTTINNIDEAGYSSITILDRTCEIIDINGDNLYEIKGRDKIYNDHGEESIENLMFSWNGNKYGNWSNTPVYTPGIFSIGNHINGEVSVKINKDKDSLLFKYWIKNNYNSEQPIKYFFITTLLKKEDFHYETPNHWELFFEIAPLIYFESNYKDAEIKKNSVLEGFKIKSFALPTINYVYLQADHVKPDYNIEEFELHYPDYLNDIYNNSFKIITVCPDITLQSLPQSNFLDSLISYNKYSLNLHWISTQSIADKYTNLFTAAKAQLQQSNINAVKSTLQTVLNEVDKDSTTNITSEAYALLRYNTEYLLGHLPEPVNSISTYSLFASHSLWLELGSKVLSGDIGVNNAGSPPFLDSQVELSAGVSTTASGYSVKANRIKVKQHAKINGDIYYNQIVNNGTIIGTKNTPLELPLFPPAGEAGSSLPEFKTSTPGTQNIIIEANKERVLQPGSYGNIDVKMNGRLIFTGGSYNIKNLNAGFNAKLIFQSASEIRIAGKFDTNEGSYIGPQDTTVLTAKDIKFYVAGINGTAGTISAAPKAAKIGIKNKVKANFYVPNGTLWIMMNSDAEGAFIAKDISIGVGTKIKLNSAF